MNSWHLLFYNLSITFYTLSIFVYLYHLFYKKTFFKHNLDHVFLLIAFLFQTLFIILRWSIIGHAPVTSMFEYLNILSFFIVLSYLIMNRIFKMKMIGFIVNVLILIIIIFSSILSKEITPLIPALNSYWLGLHVSLAALGEGFFTISFIASFIYLIKVSANRKYSRTILELLIFIFISFSIILIAQLWLSEALIFLSIAFVVLYLTITYRTKTLMIDWIRNKLRDLNLDLLDQLSYQSIAFGYPIFTLGALVFAMLWAEQAWGSYWSWDPKETWALISWLFYGLYLHLRLSKGWKQKETAWISVLGFVIILFTLLGVTYLMPGNHTYI